MKQVLFTALILLLTYSVYCQPGTLDKSFGKDGIVADNEPSYHFATVQQADGKLLTAGTYDLQGALVERFLPDGRVDSSFGKNGFAFINLSAESYDLILQPDGRIVAVGSVVLEEGDFTCVARFKQDGSLDSSFGTNGITLIPEADDYSGYNRIALEPDGSIILSGAGTSKPETLDTEYMLLARLSSNGDYDETFGGTTGRVVNWAGIRSTCIAIQQDGRILTGGYTFGSSGTGGRNFVTSRYNRDGSLDNTFGGSGNVFADGMGGDTPGDVLIQPDGRIVIGGYSNAGNGYMAALRYNEDGTPDNTFDGDGKAFVSFGDSSAKAFSLALQSDGKIILAGATFSNGAGQGADFALCRLNSNGSVDSSFATDGRQITVLSTSEQAFAATLQLDGKIVLAGNYYDDEKGYSSALLVRYNGDNTKQPLSIRIKRWLQHHGISWQRGNNIRYYAVQRSTDGIVYKEIAKLSNSSNNYEDAAPLTGNSYYRLAAIAKDGSRTYSNTVLIDETQQVKMFPNPVKDNLQLQGLAANGKTAVSVVDLQGNVRATATAGGSSYNVNTANLSPGNYLLKLQHNGTVTTRPFVKE